MRGETRAYPVVHHIFAVEARWLLDVVVTYEECRTLEHLELLAAITFM